MKSALTHDPASFEPSRLTQVRDQTWQVRSAEKERLNNKRRESRLQTWGSRTGNQDAELATAGKSCMTLVHASWMPQRKCRYIVSGAEVRHRAKEYGFP